MADNYFGSTSLLVSSSYLYDTLKNFKEIHVDTKVDAETGKGLSTNDLTDELKNSYDTAVANAHTHENKTVLDGITDVDITNWNSKADGDHTHDDYVSDISVTGDGNAITSIDISGNTITANKESTFLTAHPTITLGTDTTITDTPEFGDSFTAISGITRDENGHVTQIETKTITLPSAPTATLSFETTDLDLTSLT